MDKISFLGLWDLYNGLLTTTQQEITNLYFNLDLTLSEIAEQKGITRQGVSECLKTCKKQLEEYENKLHFAENLRKWCLETSFMMTDACRWAENFASANPQFADEVGQLKDILGKDYSKEAEQKLEDPETQLLLNKSFTAEYDGKKADGE